MSWLALLLAGCTPQAEPPAGDDDDDTDVPPTDTVPDDTGTPPDTGTPTTGERCGPDALFLAEQYFCAPDFTLPDHTGAPITRSDHLGKIVIVEVVAMWCQPCREMSTDVMEPLREAYGDQLEIVSIVSEDVFGADPTVDDAANWRQSLDLQYIVVADVEGDVSPEWDRGGVVPMSYVIDQDGVITWFANGRGTLDEFTREVEALLP